jgi:hypothetical protein
MIRLLLICLSVLITAYCGSRSHGQEDDSRERLHFTLVQENESAKLLPVVAAKPIAAGETRISCREVEFCMKYNKARTIFVECRIETVDSVLEGERVTVEYGSSGIQFSGAGLKNHFKTAEAEAKYKENLRRQDEQLQRDSIDQGMIESEKEHRREMLHQLRRTFISGESQIMKRRP